MHTWVLARPVDQVGQFFTVSATFESCQRLTFGPNWVILSGAKHLEKIGGLDKVSQRTNSFGTNHLAQIGGL